MLYVLLFKQNSLGKLILLMLLTTLIFHIEINLLSRKRTPSSNSSYKVRVPLSNKIKVTKVKKVAMPTRQMK